MVGSSTDDSNIDTIFFVPTGKTIDDINPVPSIQIIDSSFPVNFPDLNIPLVLA